MGGVSRVVSGSVFVFAVLEENDESGVLCIICIWFGDNDYRYDCTRNAPGNYALADQLRGDCDAFGACDRTGREPVYAEAGERTGGEYVCVL